MSGNSSSRNTRGLWLCAAAAIAVRVIALLLSPAFSFPLDHVSYMAWADYAAMHGPTRIYDLPPKAWINTYHPPPLLADAPLVSPMFAPDACNYPPLAIYILWGQGTIWRQLDSHVVTNPIPREDADSTDSADSKNRTGTPPATVTSRVANTRLARAINALPSIIADFFLAWGIAAIACRLAAAPCAIAAGRAAFCIALLLPPFFLNSSLWTQTDSWIMSVLVWCIVTLIDSKYGIAGLLYGLALMTKPQAVLFLPVLGYVGLARFLSPDSRKRLLVGIALFASTAAFTIAIIAAPFFIADRFDPQFGPLRWLHRAYLEPILNQHPQTTLNAYNLWWLELLNSGDGDSRIAMFGLSKDAIGRILAAAGLLASFLVCTPRTRAASADFPHRSLVAFAFLVMLTAFILPTRVHDRYIYYCLPFLTALAVVQPRLRAALLALTLVATAEHIWFFLYHFMSADTTRYVTGGLALLAVVTYAYALAACYQTFGKELTDNHSADRDAV